MTMHSHSPRSILLRLALIAAMTYTAAVGAAPQGSPPQGGEPVNVTCPVTPEERVDPDIVTEYEGQRIAFCCQRCRRQFERQPAAYLANLQVASASTPIAGADDGVVPAASAVTEHGHVGDADEDAHEHPSDQQESVAHDHSAHEHGEAATGLPHVLTWLGKFHPATVHFPIGLFLAAALAELLLMVTGNEFFVEPARYCVALAAAGAVAAAVLGWLFGGIHLRDPDWIMTVHRWTGTATAVWATVVLALSEVHRRQRRPDSALRYRLALFLGAGLVSAAGFLGGSLVYGLDHYAW